MYRKRSVVVALTALFPVSYSSGVRADDTDTPHQNGGAIGDDGTGLMSYFYSATATSPEASGNAPEVNAASETETRWDPMLLDEDREGLVTIVITLPDRPLDFTRFQEASVPEAEDLVAERRAQLEPLFQDAISALRSTLGEIDVFSEAWLSPSLSVSARADIVQDSIGTHLKGILAIELDGITRTTVGYTEEETRVGTRAKQLISMGHDGLCCGRSGARVRVGIIDQGPVYPNHPGWDDIPITPVGSRTRMVTNYNCQSGICYSPLSGVPSNDHGLHVTWIALASIEEGQDPAITSVSDRVQHSGTAKEADFIYYNTASISGFKAALQNAIINGVDIANYSQTFQFPEARCAPENDVEGGNAAINNALDAGVLLVAGADNVYGRPACTLGWPAQRSEVVTVGALYTGSQSIDYNSTGMWEVVGLASSYGGIPAKLASTGAAAILAGVDLVAPGYRSGFGKDIWYSYFAGTKTGTSRAAPAVTAAAALVVDALQAAGWSPGDKRSLKAQLLLLGDHWNAELNAKQGSGLSRWSGAGRMRAHAPSPLDLTAPWAWGWRSVVIHNGDQIDWPVGSPGAESCSITQWKWAAYWTELNLSAIADIDFKVVNKCPGVPEAVIASDTGLDIVSKFSLGTSQICGKCLFMRAIGYSVPAAGRTIYSADYFHSGTTTEH